MAIIIHSVVFTILICMTFLSLFSNGYSLNKNLIPIQSKRHYYSSSHYFATKKDLSSTTNTPIKVVGEGIFQRKNLPVFGVCVGLTALFFQLFVLYPWHEVLRDDFTALSVITKGEVLEDKVLEDKLDQLIKIDLDILKKLK